MCSYYKQHSAKILPLLQRVACNDCTRNHVIIPVHLIRAYSLSSEAWQHGTEWQREKIIDVAATRRRRHFNTSVCWSTLKLENNTAGLMKCAVCYISLAHSTAASPAINHQQATKLRRLSDAVIVTARSYAKRGIFRRRVSMCVCVCVCHTPVLYQNG